MKIKLLLLIICGSLTSVLFAQQEITVEDIWQKYTFYPRFVPGFNFQNDGKHYTRLEDNEIRQYDLTTGELSKVLFSASEVKNNPNFSGQISSYHFSDDESKIMIETDVESIYRHSSRAHFYIWDRKSEKLITLFEEGKQRYALFSPSANKVTFFYKNDLYVKSLKSEKVTRITSDGKYNHIINGGADWVYEEEFSFDRAFEWSADGNKVAFLRFDESRVKEFTMKEYRDGLYPEPISFKYPKVGEDNAIVTVHIYDIPSGKTIKVATGDETDIYFPRIKWTKDPNQLCVFRMNRHQNDLELLLADAKTGKTSLLLKETNPYYVDIHDNLTFLDDKEHFIWTSEQDGYNHIYLYKMDGKMKRQLTKGEFDVTNFYGWDEDKKRMFYQAAEKSPLERQVYSVDIRAKDKKLLTPATGTNNVQFSSTFDYYVNTHSTANQANTYTVYNLAGEVIRVIEDNQAIADLQKTYNTQPVEFFSFETSEKVSLNGYMIKPPNFNESQEYPVFMYVYGGPGSQTAADQFGGFNYWWFQMLAQKGYIVVSVDNRGTGARGQEFKKMTYLQLGKYETIDQIEAAKYLGGLPYVDASRIGIFGWSYGGYMSSLCLSKGNDVFKAAIAVAPVTNWKWYDTIYTERYMRTEKENPDGYRDNSPVYFADRIKGSFLLVHGMADDNVHFQNTTEMVNALVNANVQFDTYFYPNRNHGIYGGNTRNHLYVKMTNFVLDNL